MANPRVTAVHISQAEPQYTRSKVTSQRHAGRSVCSIGCDNTLRARQALRCNGRWLQGTRYAMQLKK
jgi:hypothetical protein